MIIYEGPSLLDGKPIVVIATSGSKNTKTGDMVQTWVISAGEESPGDCIKTGDDFSVCGDCKHRGTSCYVKVFQAPRSVWAKYKRDGYTHVAAKDVGRDKHVRLGSYGDPAAVPFEVWRELTSDAEGWTGYTHQWASLTTDWRLSDLVMASVDNPTEKSEAKAMGWRTFRIKLENEGRDPREARCPASAEGGRKLTCQQCQACDGLSNGRVGDVAINVHGATSKQYVTWRNETL